MLLPLHFPLLVLVLILHSSPAHSSSTCPTLLTPDPPPPSPDLRIVNGDLVSPTLLPALVALFIPLKNSWTSICSGVLISPLWLLTAAHCNLSTSHRVLLLAQNTNLVHNSRSHFVRIRQAVPHPEYLPRDTDNPFDIMLIRLRKSVTGVDYMALNLHADIPLSNTIARIAGYGRTEEGSRQRDRWAMQVDVPIVSPKECSRRYSGVATVDETRHVCAGYLDVEGKGCGGCHGDSGGPLFQYTKSGHAVVVAVVSSGVGCAREEYPTLYVSVRPHEEWMRGVMKKEFPENEMRVDSVFWDAGRRGIGVGGILSIVAAVLLIVIAMFGAVFVVRRKRGKKWARMKGSERRGGGLGAGMGMGVPMWDAAGLDFNGGSHRAEGMIIGVGVMDTDEVPMYGYDSQGRFRRIGRGGWEGAADREGGDEEGRGNRGGSEGGEEEGAGGDRVGSERPEEEASEVVIAEMGRGGFGGG